MADLGSTGRGIAICEDWREWPIFCSSFGHVARSWQSYRGLGACDLPVVLVYDVILIDAVRQFEH